MQNLNDTNHAAADRQTAVFGGGCFWCTEAVFTAMRGVLSVQSGYCGGSVQNPTYEQVCGKETGHIEVVKIEFDAQQTDFTACSLRRTTRPPQGGKVMTWGHSISLPYFTKMRHNTRRLSSTSSI